MENKVVKHYSAEDVCTYLFKVTSVKSVVCAKGETADEIVISFMLPSRLHNICDVLKFVYSSSNLSFKICGSSTSSNATYVITIDVSLPF